MALEPVGGSSLLLFFFLKKAKYIKKNFTSQVNTLDLLVYIL